MIISKTPLRISFFSGGSDLPAFYTRETGAALSVTIDKYVYVMAHKTPHIGIRTMYDKIEESPIIEDMQHVITREALKHFFIQKEITVASISDVLAKGSGLGSSSAFTVGLVNTLSYLRWQKDSSKTYLADIACQIEMNKCNYPVGKQDQYAAAFGGINLFEFKSDDSVVVNNINISRDTLQNLEKKLLLVYSGIGRDGNKILQAQQSAMTKADKFAAVARGRDKAYKGLEMLQTNQLDHFGYMLGKGWTDKKQLASSISDEYFDSVYDIAIKSGAAGGKLLGAGGGGFFLFYTNDKEKTKHAINADAPLCKVYDFKFSFEGSQLLAID